MGPMTALFFAMFAIFSRAMAVTHADHFDPQSRVCTFPIVRDAT